MDAKALDAIRAEYQRRRALEAEYSRISDLYPHDDIALYQREEAIENELARGFSDMDVKALLAHLDAQAAEVERLQAIEAAARQMAKTYLWQDEAAAKAHYHLRGVLHQYDKRGGAGDGDSR